MPEVDQLADLLFEWEELTAQRPTLTVDEFLGDRVQWISPFRQLLVDLGRIAPMLKDREGPPDPPQLVGRYRPFEFHAQGGLGQVFRAKDSEVGRDVAIKVIRPDALLRGGSRRRFVREAELTGRLEHPGIVPVYGLCKDRRGQPYYAMRFVDGATFESVILDYHGSTAAEHSNDPSARNVELRRLLRHFVAVCETMAYAHEQGVIHRDLKPKNVMIGRFGETIVVDWGLAKNLKETIAAEPEKSSKKLASLPNAEADTPMAFDDATLGSLATEVNSKRGDLLGTPAFMSPEQARGEIDELGPATDIYGLGATLYQLLTGKPSLTKEWVGGRPNCSTDRVTQSDFLDAVAAGHFPAPRQVKADVPKALEAICLKSMRLDPKDRYGTAKELAADVERWLADEPVIAWREPFGVRARRWLRRHRTLVSAAAAVLLVLGMTVSIAAVMLGEKNFQLANAATQLENKNNQLATEIDEKSKLNAQLGEKNVQLADAARMLENKNDQLAKEIDEKNRLNAQMKEEKAKLEASYTATRDNFDLADRSIVVFAAAVNVRLPGGEQVPGPVRDALNTEARDYYRKFIANNRERAELRLELAFAYLRQSEAEIGLRNELGAVPLLDESRRRFEAILAEAPNDPYARYGLGCVDMNAAMVQIHQLKVAEARKLAERSCAAFSRLCGEKPPAGRWYTGLESPAFKLAQAVMALRDVEARTDPRHALPFAPEVKANDDGRVLPYARIAEKALSAELAGRNDAPVEERAILGLLLVCLGEELAIRNHSADALKALQRARGELTAVVKEYPTAYEIETMLYFNDFYLALAARDDKSGNEIRLMTQVRDRLRELGNRQWGRDRFAVRNRAWLFAAQSSTVLGRWAAQRTDRAQALRHLRDALGDLEQVKSERNVPDLATRIPLVFALNDVLEAMNTLEEDVAPIKKLLERVRSELAEMAPALGDIP
jgi:serine/threonine protein kinase